MPPIRRPTPIRNTRHDNLNLLDAKNSTIQKQEKCEKTNSSKRKPRTTKNPELQEINMTNSGKINDKTNKIK
jgi:hypothetical protein